MLILCSASPRRRELLAAAGLSFEVVRPDIDETRRPGEPVQGYVERLAREKVQAGLSLREKPRDGQSPLVGLAADTIVVVGDEVLGKPRDRSDAARMLSLLSGSAHAVITGVAVQGVSLRVKSARTLVRFRQLSEAELRFLTDSGDGDDKAGAYAVQGLAAMFVDGLEGSLTNVIGLPVPEALELLAAEGVVPPWA